ncbi:HAD superfamily hydrolase [Natronomonas moolapensis 8.8.11]|uniref:HAD superfamily hydrolase n=1 Tax=Natronomonas moolapensis (strain DSM 18674 / CECT 7526 / JCM 14361 / 8.8.11) TaxID=268739 RepID=M1XQV1_NATM8|nr:HAD-IIA family hydrolase [Natronomonas moolapensis]CCQ36552.1 HAD superfamily hydrolase [Natronomonas moolapensis 8.8.11]
MDYEGAVLDLDGTVYRGDKPISGALEAIERFRTAGIEPLFFSNNPTKSREAYTERLGGFGLDVDPGAVLSAGTVTTRYLVAEHADDTVFLIGDDGLRAQFEAEGVDLAADPTEADVLVASWTRAFEYDDMVAGYEALRSGATFYATDPDRLIPAAEGMTPGSGAIVNAVGGPLDRDPKKTLGKPSTEARRAALDALGCPAERCFVVGDRLNTDIELGERAGMTTVLVRTGIATDDDVSESAVQPDYVADSLADVPEVLELGGTPGS